MLKKILLVLVGLLVLLVVVALVLPSKWQVVRSTSMKATPEVIYTSVADLKQWETWAAWNKEMDPTAKWEFSGSPTGQGAVMSWKGDKMGTGTLTVTRADPKTGIEYTMTMERMQTPAAGSIAFSPDGPNTKVTWTDSGDFGMFLPGRFFVGFMEKMLGQQFDQGLAKLKVNAEKAQAAADEAAAQAAAKAKAEAEAAAAAAAAAAAEAEAAAKAKPGKKVR